MLARIASEALSGLEGHPVEVEADVVAAAPAFSIVGLPDAAVQESRERVRAAIVNGGGATDFCARFLDAADKPLKGFTVSVVDAAK